MQRVAFLKKKCKFFCGIVISVGYRFLQLYLIFKHTLLFALALSFMLRLSTRHLWEKVVFYSLYNLVDKWRTDITARASLDKIVQIA